MANKKKKRSKGAAPADATYTSTARPEERSAAPYEIYTADVNNHGSESSAAAHSLSKIEDTMLIVRRSLESPRQ